MRNTLYEEMRRIDDESFSFGSMRRITMPSGYGGAMADGTWVGRVLNRANSPNKTTRMLAHNGGCSRASGMIPVSVPRVTFIDDEQVVA